MFVPEVIAYFSEGDVHNVPAGQPIFEAGDAGLSMYFIVSGEVQITVQGRLIDYLKAGQIFGEMALVDNRVRSARATAVADCQLAVIDKPRFAALSQQLPDFATTVMAIMSTRLRRFMEEEVKRLRLEEEMAIGRQIQLSLLPESCPTIPGWEFVASYRAAQQVGGDLYDFIPDPDNPHVLHLVIADVTGKGVPAAMFMAVCRTIIRTEAMYGRSPAALLRRTNHHLIAEQRGWPFLSAFFASLNTQTGQLTYAIGGHNRPYWVQASNGRWQQVPGRGMLLGAFPNAFLEDNALVLAPGDCLILYTDGITEAHHEEDLFDEARLEAVITANVTASAQTLSQKILAAVEQFTANTAQSDDITLVVIKRQPLEQDL